MGVHLLVLPFKMGIYRKRNVHQIGSSLYIARGVIINYSQLSPGSLYYAGLNHQILCVTPRTLV